MRVLLIGAATETRSLVEEALRTLALKRLAVNAERLFGITCTFEELRPVLIEDNGVATHLYRIAQEAVSNGAKHGRASHIAITLAVAGDNIRLRVRDNGSGFVEPEPVDSPTDNRGMGTRIMHYRARILGGTLEIRAEPGGGTTVSCTIPRPHSNGRRPSAALNSRPAIQTRRGGRSGAV